MPIQLRTGIQIFVVLWMFGWLINIFLYFNNRHHWNAEVESIVAAQPIRINGALRWMFGFKPATGSISLGGFMLQATALLILMSNIALSLIWPTVNFSWAMVILTPFLMVISYWFGIRVLHNQTND
jgi:hypothetical protein